MWRFRNVSTQGLNGAFCMLSAAVRVMYVDNSPVPLSVELKCAFGNFDGTIAPALGRYGLAKWHSGIRSATAGVRLSPMPGYTARRDRQCGTTASGMRRAATRPTA